MFRATFLVRNLVRSPMVGLRGKSMLAFSSLSNNTLTYTSFRTFAQPATKHDKHDKHDSKADHHDHDHDHDHEHHEELEVFNEKMDEALYGPFGTRESPVIVKSVFNNRIVGCVGSEEDPHGLLWHIVRSDKVCVCLECGQHFKLDQIADASHGHH
eukprot:TRINITY_DN223_c0_g1_i1.p1 TRINITY_DN223_c0_g1~~TRINITY_DN223_c0_g1_i1.p1  ORF type:complete len:156 (+),score=17.73 TRINITY_DN223_c0_g1_i1:108-575(+)